MYIPNTYWLHIFSVTRSINMSGVHLIIFTLHFFDFYTIFGELLLIFFIHNMFLNAKNALLAVWGVKKNFRNMRFMLPEMFLWNALPEFWHMFQKTQAFTYLIGQHSPYNACGKSLGEKIKHEKKTFSGRIFRFLIPKNGNSFGKDLARMDHFIKQLKPLIYEEWKHKSRPVF